jgi:hypothetical protein
MVEERRRGRGKVRDLELSIGDVALAMEVLFVAGRSGSRVGSRSPSRGMEASSWAWEAGREKEGVGDAFSAWTVGLGVLLAAMGQSRAQR